MGWLRRTFLLKGGAVAIGVTTASLAGVSSALAEIRDNGPDERSGKYPAVPQHPPKWIAERNQRERERIERRRAEKKMREDLSGDPTRNSNFSPAEDTAPSVRSRAQAAGTIPSAPVEPPS